MRGLTSETGLNQKGGGHPTWRPHFYSRTGDKTPPGNNVLLCPHYLLGLYYLLGDSEARTWGVYASINTHPCPLLMNASPSP